MHGDIIVYQKQQYSQYKRIQGIYDKTGMYKMQSIRGTNGYIGKQGKARCIAIPQCKMMNSTVLDINANHKVHIGNDVNIKYDISNYNKIKSISTYINQDMHLSHEQIMKKIRFYVEGQHIPFDIWVIMGAVLGKVLLIWRTVADKDMKQMPSWMTITISQIFETINPGCDWQDLSVDSKYYWRKKINQAFHYLYINGLCYDLPDNEHKGKRIIYKAKSILENTWIKRRALGKVEQDRCIKQWGQVWQPWGYKVKIKGNAVFDFCWRKGRNSPSVVQLRDYDYNCKNIFDIKGWNKCFATIWVSWKIQYMNYCMKHGMDFTSCKLSLNKKQMKYCFKDSIFDIKLLSSKQIQQILQWYSVKKVFETKQKRPAHISKYEMIKRGQFIWQLPRNLQGDHVILKNESGNNISIKESGITQISGQVKLAYARMKFINEQNLKHEVLLGKQKIDVKQSVIYRVNGDKIDDKHNGRCYSMKNGIQSLKKETRRNIRIDGMKSVQVDYKSLHPNMLYAMNKVFYSSKDMYDVGRWYSGYGLSVEQAKQAVKMLLLRMINARSKYQAMYSFKTGWNQEHGINKNDYIIWLTDLFDRIQKKHQKIKNMFCTGIGTELMNKDGKLIRQVCYRLTRQGICAIGIHDSVLVGEKYKNRAKQVMQEQYKKMFNCDIQVSFK